MKNKTLWLILASLLIGAAWAVASGDEEGAEAERPTIRIVVYDESDTDWSADLWQSQQLADAGGVIFEYQAIPGADFVVKRNAWIASGNLPDIWHDRVERPKDIADNIGPKGLLVPINEHLDALPNLVGFMNKYPQYESAMTSPDGNQYGVAYIYDFVPFSSAPAIRGYILEEKGIDPREDIQTMDDLHNALSVIKQHDMEMKGEENFPWTARHPGRFVDTIGMMWGVRQNMFYDDRAGAYQYGPLSPRFRLMVDFVRQAYEDGLIHPDVWSMPDEVMEGLSRQERVHFWVDNIWNGYFWGDREGKDQLEMTDHPFVTILPPMVEGERYYASRAGNNVDTGQLWLVSAKTEHLDNVLRMIDWGLSDEGIYAMAMGKENYSYVRDDQGMRIWPAPGLFTGTRAYNPDTGEAKDFAAEMTIDDPANFQAPEPWVILSKEFKNIWRAFPQLQQLRVAGKHVGADLLRGGAGQVRGRRVAVLGRRHRRSRTAAHLHERGAGPQEGAGDRDRHALGRDGREVHHRAGAHEQLGRLREPAPRPRRGRAGPDLQRRAGQAGIRAGP